MFENEWHCFFGCIAVREALSKTGLWDMLEQYVKNASGFVELVFELMEVLDRDTMASYPHPLDDLAETKSKVLK